MIRHVDFDVVKVIIIASPGFIKDDLFKYIMADAVSTDKTTILQNKSRIILAHSTSGHKHALQEILVEPAIKARLVDTKYLLEVKTLERFYQVYHICSLILDHEHNAFESILRL
jgi:protein pelota